MSKFDHVFKSMQTSPPNLLLGAGFSLGAINEDGKSLPAGGELSESLYENFLKGSSLITDMDIEDDIVSKKKSLPDICDYLETYRLQNERNEYLTKGFSGAHATDSWHKLIVSYPWNYIFTLNIDDLVENLYKDYTLNVWEYTGQVRIDESVPTLVKLHGSVSHPENGYIFSTSEYNRFSNAMEGPLREFAEQFLRKDLILIGTQFDEQDLSLIIDLYERLFSGEKNSLYFISPSVGPKLKARIGIHDNWSFISGTAEEFFTEMNQAVNVVLDLKQLLIERGVVFIADVDTRKNANYQIYHGGVSQYLDFLKNIDIKDPKEKDWLQDVLCADHVSFTVFHGENYSGKTCCAKRLLVDLYHRGYVALELSNAKKSVLDLLAQYLNKLPENSKAAVFVDDAAYYYKDILSFTVVENSTVDKLAIIAADLTSNHNGKRYILKDQEAFFERLIGPHMPGVLAKEICQKLTSNRHLDHFLNLIPKRLKPETAKAKKIIIEKIKSLDDTIDALFYATEGTSFKDHYTRWNKEHIALKDYGLIRAILLFESLGVTSVPILFVKDIGTHYNPTFTIHDFLDDYKDIATIKNGNIRLIRDRMLASVIAPYDRKEVIYLIEKAVGFFSPENESVNDENEHNFEKVLKVKRILRQRLLSKDDLLEVFRTLETRKCKDLSYFRVQYGIAAQENGEFEEADNQFLYASRLRANSYKVQHAYAKNLMEWGISLESKGMPGTDKMETGSDLMMKIIENRRYSDSYSYSVHTYVNLWLKHNKVTGQDITPMRCLPMKEKLRKSLTGSPDEMVITCASEFATYCNRHGMKSIADELMGSIRGLKYVGALDAEAEEDVI